MFKEYKNNYRVINNLDDKDKSLKNIKYHNKHKNTDTSIHGKLGEIYILQRN